MTRLGAATAALALLIAPGTSFAAATTTDDRAITHLLSRATFGPRPGDVARVRALGPAAWLEQQLHPGRIDDSATDAGAPEPRELSACRFPICCVSIPWRDTSAPLGLFV